MQHPVKNRIINNDLISAVKRFENSLRYFSFTKLSFVWHIAKTMGHSVKIELTDNVLLTKLSNLYTARGLKKGHVM